MAASNTTKAHLAMLLFSFFVAGTYSLGHSAVPYVDPTALMALRFLISGLIMGIVVLLTCPVKKRRITHPWRFLLLGTIFAIYFAAMFQALLYTSAISVGAMFTITPFLTAGFAWLLLRQKSSIYILLSLSIAAVGALWIVFKGDLNALLTFEFGRGEKIFFIGIVAHALYIPLARKLDYGEPLSVFTFGVLSAGSVPLLLVSYKEILNTDWTALPLIVWVTLTYMVIFSTLLTFVLLQFSNQRLPGSKVMAYTYLIPSWGILWEMMLGRGFDETSMLFGIVLTIIAMLMLLRHKPG